MIYYPLGPGLQVSGEKHDTWKFPFQKVAESDGSRESGSLSFSGRVASGKVHRSKGKPTTVLGRKWSPPRSYLRTATRLFHNNGVDVYDEWHAGKDWTVSKNGPAFTRGLFDWAPTWTWFEGEMSPNQYAQLNTELLIKIGRRQVNYGESLGEARSTFRHLAKTASTIARAFLAARKGRWYEVPKILGVPRKKLKNGSSAAEKWLEYQYGWLPLMGDVYDTYQLLDKGLQTGPQLFHAERNLKESLTEVIWSDFTRADGRIDVGLKAKAFYRIDDSTIASLHQLGLINPLEVAWALVPFSFVVDWFIPVGNVLEAYTARMGVTFVGGFYGRRCNMRYISRNNFSSANLQLRSSTWRAVHEGFSYRRTVMASLPWPMPYVKSPFSSTHAISALALIRQLWR